MKKQLSLFRGSGPVAIPLAPSLVPHTNWPHPGMTPEASAQAATSHTEAYHEMLAAVIKSKGSAGGLTAKQVLAFVPQDWRDACGKYAHGSIAPWVAQRHSIKSTYVSHDGGGFHFEFMVEGGAA